MCRKGGGCGGGGGGEGGGGKDAGEYSAKTELQQRSVSLILKQNAQRGWEVGDGGWGRGCLGGGEVFCKNRTSAEAGFTVVGGERTAKGECGGWRGWVSGLAGRVLWHS